MRSIGATMTAALTIGSLSLGALASAVRAQDIVDVVAPLSFHIGPATDRLQIRYFANRPLDDTYGDINRAVVIIHGTLRNADDYFNDIVEGAGSTPGGDTTTLLVAPQFLTEDDLDEHALPEDMLFWAYMGWRQGDDSRSTTGHPRPWTISAYAVADSIFARLAAHNPNLEKLVICGHSAGGQFVNRFAAGSRMHEPLVAAGIDVRYVVSNPSTYVYLDGDRWRPGSAYAFGLPAPDVIQSCPEYNDYKYGLDNPNPYMSLDPALIRQQYGSREVVYLQGEYDDDPSSYYLDRECPAMIEGLHRRQRGLVYAEHLIRIYGPGIFDLHEFTLVPRISHDHTGIFTSDCGVRALFDHGACTAVSTSHTWAEVTNELTNLTLARAAAWGDFDDDGNADLYLASAGDDNRLLRGLGDGSFEDATSAALADAGSAMSVAWGDIDNDRDLDLYVANWKSPNRLFRNDGPDGFVDVTHGQLGLNSRSCDVVWGDLDNDGDLDLVVSETDGRPNSYFRNDDGTFVDASHGPFLESDDTRGIGAGDYDDDGDLDLYLANDGANRLLRNEGGVFVDVTAPPLDDGGDGSSGIWGDVDNDGDLDLYLANRSTASRLFRNDGPSGFADITAGPIGDVAPVHAAVFGDVDNDGDLDLYLGLNAWPNRLLRNDGSGAFTDATEFPLDDRGSTYSVTLADPDADGDLDLYLVTSGAANRHLANRPEPGPHFLQVDLRGTESNSSGVGARIFIIAGGLFQMREIGGGSGYRSQSPLTAHFGLGAAALVDTLWIEWPSGIVQTFADLIPDRHLRIQELAGTVAVAGAPADDDAAPASASIPALTLTGVAPNPFRHVVAIDYRVARPGVASVRIYDAAGRLARTLVADAPVSPGRFRVSWDGLDGRGRPAAAGVYVCRLESGDATAARRITLLR